MTFPANIDLSSLDGTNGFGFSPVTTSHFIRDPRFGGGVSVASAGDVNGDGFADLIIGNPYSGQASYVVFGKESGFGTTFDLSSLDGSNGFRLEGAPSSYSGYSVVLAGGAGDDVLLGGTPTC
jgi:hypothetical protein